MARMKAKVTQNQMEFVGVLVRGLMRCQYLCPGTAPSRLNAKSILELAVTEAMPQNAWAMTVMMRSSSAPTRDSAVSQMATGAAVFAAVAAYVAGLVGITDVMARIRIHPAMSETTIDVTMPRGAERSALCVSSDMWAEAS